MTNATATATNTANPYAAGYENAPATRLLATHCAICSRPLLDARSVECGVGPVCRRRHGYNEIPEAVRVEANRIVYRIACLNSGHPAEDGETIVAHLTALGLLGCHKIAAKLADGLGAIEVVTEGFGDDTFGLKSPYNPDAVAAMRSIPGRQWDRAAKLNSFPRSSWPQVAAMLKAHYPNTVVRQSTGAITSTVTDDIAPGFDVPAAAPASTANDNEGDAPAIQIRKRGNTLYVRTPYSRGAVAAMRSIRGRKYQGEGVNSFPASKRDDVLALCAEHFPGMTVDEGDAAAVTSERPEWANVDTDAPEVEYDPAKADHRAWLAEQIVALMEATGCTKVQAADLPRRCDEDVYGLELGGGVQLRVYTSIKGGSCRNVGTDAVRVCAVKRAPQRRRGAGVQPRWVGVARTTRVHRTGTMAACVARVLQRMVDVAADVATPAL